MEKKLKFYQGGIMVLIILNISLIGWQWFGKRSEPPRPQDILKRELQLTDVQMKDYVELIREHRKVADAIEYEMRQLKRNLFNFSQPDSIKEVVAQKISQVQQQLDIQTYMHFKKVRDLCTDEQKSKFEEVLLKALDRRPRPKPRED